MASLLAPKSNGPRTQPVTANGDFAVIDIGGLRCGNSAARRSVAREIGIAARDPGVFYVHGHAVDENLVRRVYAQAKVFFDQPEAAKLRCHIAHSHNHRGYVPFSERGEYEDEQGERHYEAFDLGLDLPTNHPAARKLPLTGPNAWPSLHGFREVIAEYYQAVTEVGRSLCRAFEISLDLEEGYFDRFMRTPTSQLRLLHYVENEAAALAGPKHMGAHTDYECFTILHQTKPGLQTWTADGQWENVPPIPGTFVINIGDMMEVWTNGEFPSNPHRVHNTGDERFSLPFFVVADYDAVIQPVPTMISANRPPAYAPVVAGEHLLRQLFRDFPYLRNRADLGLIPDSLEDNFINTFERSKLGPGPGVEQAA